MSDQHRSIFVLPDNLASPQAPRSRSKTLDLEATRGILASVDLVNGPRPEIIPTDFVQSTYTVITPFYYFQNLFHLFGLSTE